MTRTFHLVLPTMNHLPGYAAALRRGWSPDNLRPEASDEELALIESDPQAFVASMVDIEAAGPPITFPDGSRAPRLPGYRCWMWDEEFCGSIGLRWQPGTPDLPAHCLGHIGYSVVPWKRRRGYASAALALMLPDARSRGLPHVEITTNLDNIGSQRVIEANGGVLLETFVKPAAYGGASSLRYRIAL